MGGEGRVRVGKTRDDWNKCVRDVMRERTADSCTTTEVCCVLFSFLFDSSLPLTLRYSQVFVSPGDKVAKGDTLITVEGMKMEVSKEA